MLPNLPSKPAIKDSQAFAFPLVVDIPNPLDPRMVTRQVITGMTLRDYFAAQAIKPMTIVLDGEVLQDVEAYVATAYKLADAMMRAREATPPTTDSQFHEDHMRKG